MRFEIVKVTPQMAADLLSKNEGNRKLREHRAAYLSRAILEGKFKLTHQAIAISKKKRLLDGQHRLRAICLANKAVDMVVAYEVADDTFSVLDAGMPRKMCERLRSDPLHTAICNQLFKLMASNRSAHEFEMELMLELFDDALKSYAQVAGGKTNKFTKAPMGAAVILRIAMHQQKKQFDGVARIQWILEKLRRSDLTGAPPIINVYYRQTLEGVRTLDLGVAPATDQFVRAWNAFDPEQEGATRIQINDHGADIRAARIEFKLITKGVFD